MAWNLASWLLQTGYKSEKQQCHNLLYSHDATLKFFWRCFISLVTFSYWSKFHVNIITGSRVSFYKGLTRNPKIRNTLTEFCTISGDWHEVGIPNLAWMSLVEFYRMMLNARVTAFTISELLRGKPTRGDYKKTKTKKFV